MEITTRFDNGARKIKISDGVEVGVSPTDKIYWATPEGWGWVTSPDNPNIRPATTRQDAAMGVSVHHTDFLWNGTL